MKGIQFIQGSEQWKYILIRVMPLRLFHDLKQIKHKCVLYDINKSEDLNKIVYLSILLVLYFKTNAIFPSLPCWSLIEIRKHAWEENFIPSYCIKVPLDITYTLFLITKNSEILHNSILKEKLLTGLICLILGIWGGGIWTMILHVKEANQTD